MLHGGRAKLNGSCLTLMSQHLCAALAVVKPSAAVHVSLMSLTTPGCGPTVLLSRAGQLCQSGPAWASSQTVQHINSHHNACPDADVSLL